MNQLQSYIHFIIKLPSIEDIGSSSVASVASGARFCFLEALLFHFIKNTKFEVI